jgi:hypothetical protein
MDYKLPLQRLENKETKIMFFTPDSKGVPIGGVIFIYEMVNSLIEQGYNAYILTQKGKYSGVKDWMGESYDDLPHISLETEGFMLNMDDILVIPEFYWEFATQIKDHNVPCKIVLLAQAHEYIFEYMQIGQHWRDVTDTVITTSERMEEHINQVMYKMENIEIINPFVPEFFHKNPKPQKPVVALLSREIKKAEKLYQQFFNMFPQYRWVNFKTLNKLDRESFAKQLSECCLAVWIDEISSFGTFPLEAMACGVPVVGLIPQMLPEWMYDKETKQYKNNGVWVTSRVQMPQQIGLFLDMWLSNTVPAELYPNMESTVEKYDYVRFNYQVQNTFENIFAERHNFITKLLEKQQENSTNNE